MKVRHIVLLMALIALPVAAGGDRAQKADFPSSSTVSPAFAAGQVLILDPSSPDRNPLQSAEIQAELGDALSTSSDGLVIEKSKVPGGGIMVNLQGRFQNAIVLTVDDEGNTSAPCIGELPKTDTEVK